MQVGVLEAKTRLSELIDAVEGGAGDIVITRRGKPVARLSAADPANDRPRRLSGAELEAEFAALRQKIADSEPITDPLSWETFKALIHL